MKFSKTLMMTAAAAILSTGAMAQSVTTGDTTGVNTPTGSVGVDTSTTMSPSTENATEADINASAETNAGASADRVANLDASTIESVQSSLKDEGHNVSVDGVWGPRTAAALREFQQSKDLPVTGQIDTQTLAALDIQR